MKTISNMGAAMLFLMVGVSSSVGAKTVDVEKYMDGKLYTIIHKRATPPHGDSKNNYISMGPYWWPTSKENGGLPYENRDGQLNPESRTDYTDFATMHSMCDAVIALSDAYGVTKDERYAKRVKDIITTFFIDPKTRMLPNLNYAQFIPGVSDGSCFGIIESVIFEELLASIVKVQKSPAWDQTTALSFDSWFKDFYIWLTTSELGMMEQTRLNNHGTHYDGQCLAILTYFGMTKEAKNYINKYTIPRLEQHVSKDGSQQREIARTKSWNYSMMNLKGWMKLADYADSVGVDLWHYSKDGQVYIKSMVDWYIPYVKMEKPWKWRQIIRGHVDGMRPVFERAAEVYGDESYLDVARNLKPIAGTSIR